MIEFRFPSLGADMETGMLVEWRVGPGDEIHRGDIIAEVETEKGIVEIECWVDGRVIELLIQPSLEQIPVGAPIALLEPIGVEISAEAPTAEVRPGPPTDDARGEAVSPQLTPPLRHLARQLGVSLDTLPRRPDGTITRDDILSAAGEPAPEVRASPFARRRAAELGVDITTVSSRRRDGLVTADDVLAAAAERGAPVGPEADTDADDGRLIAMRSAIARSMARSKREIPHYYLGTRIDLAEATRWLEELNETRPVAGRILPAALLLRATALALRQVPELNGHWLDGAFSPAQPVHLGVAVSLRGGGLVAPAIHDADLLDIDGVMAALVDVVTRARAGRLRSSEMSDPTMTVTNLGERGVESVNPVIIPPQVAMVGFGRITEQPVAVDGMLDVRPTVHTTLAADHRVTDGHRGSAFLNIMDELLQRPEDL
jgi:pyruvate dehydrogenase E2 component (dihydrolipoamide acetyltransferase)